MRFRFLTFLMLVALVSVVISCNDEEPPLPVNKVTVSAAQLGLAEEDAQTTITINVSRAADVDKMMTLTYVPNNVTYGVEFTTEPAPVDNKITIVIPAGTTAASFIVKKTEGIFLEGSVTFTVESVEEPFVLSDKVVVNLSFSPIVSEGSEMQLQGLIASETGSLAGNAVFVDFSANVQTSVVRASWDIGFYSGDDFRVILNNAKGSSAVVVNETNLANVTAEDVDADDLAIGGGLDAFKAYDSINGDLQYTAIKEISATESQNKVYVINRVGGTGTTQPEEQFIKIRVTRNGEGYTVQYAPINATDPTTFQTLTITKDQAYNFIFLNFDIGVVSVEPAKNRWDIQWTYSVYWTAFGGPPVSYAFSDLVFINHHNGVKVDTVFTSETVTYENFTKTSLANYNLVSVRDGIGSDWRNTLSPVGVKTDRFYLVQDPQGNVYKLKFVNFHSADGGTRGKPNIKYALVKTSEE